MENYQVTIYEGTTPGKKKKSGQPTSNRLPLLLEVAQDAEVLIIVRKATEGFDKMKIKVTTEDDENEFPATMTPTKKTNEDFDRKRISP